MTVTPMTLKVRPAVLGIAAFSGTGKTTLLEKLIPLLNAMGLRIGMVKASHHDIEPDPPGKDSYRLRKAGTSQLVLSTPRRSICMTEYPENHSRRLEEQIRLLDLEHLDLVLVEGFREAPIPKIELHRSDYLSVGKAKPFLFQQDPHIMAIAWDLNPGAQLPPELAELDINQPEQVADYIAQFIDRHWQHSDLTSETTAGISGSHQNIHQETERG